MIKSESGGFEDIPGERLTRMLNLGITEKRRPIDELLDRLDEDDGPDWFENFIKAGPIASEGPATELLANGTASLDQMKSINKAGRALLKSASHREDRMAALIAYFMSIAAAVVHHETLITSRERKELDPLFFDLSASVPDPWAAFLASAVEKQPES
jgi:hypothetical protein